MRQVTVKSNDVDPRMMTPGPRNVKVKRSVDICRSILLGIIGIYGAVLPMVQVNDYKRLRLLETAGVAVNGTVTDLETSGENGQTYRASYVYYIWDKRYKGGGRVTADEFSSMTIKDPVTIYVLPSDPAFHHLGPVTDDDVAQEVTGFWEFDGIGVVIFALITLAYESLIRKQSRLLKYGVPVQANIVSVKSSGTDNGPYTMICTYSADGQEITRSFSVPHQSLGVKMAGSTVPVVYDPARPKQSMLYEQILAVQFDQPV